MNSQENKSGKTFKILLKTVYYILLVSALIFTVFVINCSRTGKTVNIMGYSLMHVVTGSMEPVIHTGDCIWVKETAPELLEAGDIITFYSDDPDISGLPNTHRIVSINDDGTFTVKGDANPETDSVPASGDRIIGKYIRKSGFFRFIFSFGSAKKLLMLLVIIPTFLVTLFESVSVTKLMRESASEKYEDRIRQAIDAEKARMYAENYKPEERNGADESGQDNETQDDCLNNNNNN